MSFFSKKSSRDSFELRKEQQLFHFEIRRQNQIQQQAEIIQEFNRREWARGPELYYSGLSQQLEMGYRDTDCKHINLKIEGTAKIGHFYCCDCDRDIHFKNLFKSGNGNDIYLTRKIEEEPTESTNPISNRFEILDL